jgi:hypothetical protein
MSDSSMIIMEERQALASTSTYGAAPAEVLRGVFLLEAPMAEIAQGPTIRPASCKRGSVDVRFAPKATEVLHCRELTRRAKT